MWWIRPMTFINANLVELGSQTGHKQVETDHEPVTNTQFVAI